MVHIDLPKALSVRDQKQISSQVDRTSWVRPNLPEMMEGTACKSECEDDGNSRQAHQHHQRFNKLLGPQTTHNSVIEAEHVELERPEDEKVPRKTQKKDLRAKGPIFALGFAHILSFFERQVRGVPAFSDLDENLANDGSCCPHKLQNTESAIG